MRAFGHRASRTRTGDLMGAIQSLQNFGRCMVKPFRTFPPARPNIFPNTLTCDRHDAKAARRGCRQEPVQPTGWRLKAAYRAAREPRDVRSGMRSSSRHELHVPHSLTLVAYSDNDASRTDPAGGRRKLPPSPANPGKRTDEKACSPGDSPQTPAQPGDTKTGLSRRRSRVRVPSLPLKTSCKVALLLPDQAQTTAGSFRSRAHPADCEKRADLRGLPLQP